MSRSHIGFDGYSYEPPSYDEAQASGSLNQSVYKPIVSQDTTFTGALRPLHTPNGYNGLSEYNKAKRRRRMRIACATMIGVLGFILFFVILFWEINLKNRYDSQSYKSLDYNTNDNLSPYLSYDKDSSVFNNDGSYREPKIDDKQIPHSNDGILDKTGMDDKMKNNNQFGNNANNFGWVADARREFEKSKKEDFGDDSVDTAGQNPFSTNTDPDKLFEDIDAFVKKKIEMLNLNPVASTSNSPTSTSEKNYVKNPGEEKPTSAITNPNANSSRNLNDKSTTEATRADASTRKFDFFEGLDELVAKKGILSDADMENYARAYFFGKRKK